MQVIESAETISTGMFTREPYCPNDSWFVYKNARGKYHIVESGNRISQIELKADNYSTRYTVKKNSYTYKNFTDYHSMDPGRDFQISVQANVSVSNPIAVVQHDIKNIQEYMAANTKYWFESITVNYKIEEFPQLKDKIHHAVANTNMIKELEKRGFTASQLQAEASLGKKEWEFYEKQETIKRDAALELTRLAEEEKIRKVEAQIKQQEEQVQRERERIANEERRKENERLATLTENNGIDRVIFERSEENRENLDLLIKREQEEKDYQQKLTLDRMEHERKKEDERLEFEMQKQKQRSEFEMELEKRKMDMFEKMIDIQMKTGDIDGSILHQIKEIFSSSAPVSTPQVETKKAERIGWGTNNKVSDRDKDESDEWR